MLEESISGGGGESKEASISSSLHTIYLFTGKEVYSCAISTIM